MPSQDDYGNGEPQLVPQSLRVYRHFILDTHYGRLWRVGGGFQGREHREVAMYGHPMARHRVYEPDAELGEDGLHRATCHRVRWPSMESLTDHESPNERCKCGFYASYDPETDFYPSTFWGEQYVREFGGRDVHDDEAGDMVLVRAVCEMQGKVIMGRLGVRAEKMKIVAAAIDWSKHMYAARQASVAPIDWNDPSANITYVVDNARGTVSYLDHERWRTGKPPRGHAQSVYIIPESVWDFRDGRLPEIKYLDTVGALEDKAQRQLAKYSVKFYTDVDEMHAEHPKPDLSALGLEPEPEPTGISSYPPGTITFSNARRAAIVDHYTQQLAMYSIDTGAIDGRPKGARKPKPSPIQQQVEQDTDSPMAAAIRAKRRRQAPPGTGIDRRKGKLR